MNLMPQIGIHFPCLLLFCVYIHSSCCYWSARLIILLLSKCRADLLSDSQRIKYTIETFTKGIPDARTYLNTLQQLRIKYSPCHYPAVFSKMLNATCYFLCSSFKWHDTNSLHKMHFLYLPFHLLCTLAPVRLNTFEGSGAFSSITICIL